MASLSLPRVLQLKKNSLDAEREQFEKFQTLAIQKATSSIETPVKEKHVRSTIIGTFQEQSAITYWMVAVRLPLQDNRIVAWKFCHVTHKLLREGHPACLDDSQRHISMIENLGKLWVHLREGYGRLVHLYCNLLVSKLKFHARNPRFPGNMQLTADELDNIAENDVNNYFQLCVELFDYMDDILSLQAAVFDSLGNARANSMTASGQCRLAALIPCAQDSSHIYDCNVRLLFRLHASLPADTLSGHRERFRQQFKKLSSFYKHASSLQYYRNLLTLPVLPSNPPNFLLQSDFGTYVTPVVSIPEPPPDEVDAVGSLIDTTDTISMATTPDQNDTFDSRTTPSPQPDPLIERDRLIDHLQNELRRMRGEVSQLVQERNTMIGSMREHCTKLETHLQTTKNELEEEKQRAEMLSAETPEIKQKLTEIEDKARVTDEKFQKLKGAYTQLREEHITLIRQKAEVDKLTANLRASAAQHESAKAALQQQLNDKMKDVELLQQSASSSEEIEAYKSELTNLRAELEQSRQKDVEIETLRASMEALEIENRTAKTEQEEKLATITNELKELSESLETIKAEKDQREKELSSVKEELAGLKERSGDEYKKVAEEKEMAVKQLEELSLIYQQEKQGLDDCINNLQSELGHLQQLLTDREKEFTYQLTQVNAELKNKTQLFDETLNKRDNEMKDALNKLILLESEIKKTKKDLSDKLVEKEFELEHLNSKIKLLDETKDAKTLVVVNLEETLKTKNKEIETQLQRINELTNVLNDKETALNANELETKEELTLLESKIQITITEKDTEISKWKEETSSKEKQIESLNFELSKTKLEVSKLEDDLKESEAELEIGKNELFSMKEEHEAALLKNDNNITLKNQELKQLQDEIINLSEEKSKAIHEKQLLKTNFALEKQVFENKLKDLEVLQEESIKKLYIVQNEKYEMVNKLNEEIESLKCDYDKLTEVKESEVKALRDKNTALEEQYITQLSEKNTIISKLQENEKALEFQIAQMKELHLKEREELNSTITTNEAEKKLLEARLEHTQSERLNTECELQDLLQHNSALEADLTAVRIQLEDAREALSKQTTKLVTCVGDATSQVTSNALAALDSSLDRNNAAAELAAKAFDELAAITEVKGNEDNIAKSAIFAAHGTAQLSAYISEVSNVSTDTQLSEKLNSECRAMLSITKQCLDSLKDGAAPASCKLASEKTLSAYRSGLAADVSGGTASVDDQLAEMDSAIQDAAKQIEALLESSRKADSGVKLEVNGKILDACTTLMAAVKILVQDARKLQNELGDPKTRQKMYRRNPQWSEGLISAAKAVVFAAKLLVTSADEAIGTSGRVEGVSAAAHEVAGSTAQLVAASRARAPPASRALAGLTAASRHVAAATGALVAVVRDAGSRLTDQEVLDTSALTLTATRRLEMESKVRALQLESALDAERARLAALRKRHYQLAQQQENGNMTNGDD